MFVFGRPEEPAGRRRIRRGLWLAALVVVVGAGIGLYVYSRGTGLTYSCAVVYSPEDKGARQRALELCHRTQRDKARRAPIRSPGPIGYDGTAARMHYVISRGSSCSPLGDPRCGGGGQARAATDADAEAARRALAQAGLADSVVRVARSEDPAPDGALVYALRMGDGCVVGYLEVGTGTGEHLVGGLLPNGQCLAS